MKNDDSELFICFVAYYAASVIFPGSSSSIGGAEVQQGNLAEALNKAGYRVGFVVGDEPGSRDFSHDQYSVFRSFRQSDGVRFIRYLYPQLVKLWRALRSANAKWYYVRGLRDETSILYLYCIANRARYVLALASDRECSLTKFPVGRWNPKRHLLVRALRRADLVFAQSEWQRDELQKNFGVKAKVVSNIVPVPRLVSEPKREVHNVLWVGTVVPNKRPQWYVELARRHPGIRFRMIGPSRPGHETFHSNVLDSIEATANIAYHDFVPPAEIARFYSEADLFVLTSEYEGFPNVLLQSWAVGVPVLTTCDPDGVVDKFKLGLVVADERDLHTKLGELVAHSSGELLDEMGKNGREYVQSTHAPDRIARSVLQLLEVT